FGHVDIYKNDGTGHVVYIGAPITTDACPENIAAGDLNGDGITDLAVATYCNGGKLDVVLGKPAGLFAAAVGIDTLSGTGNVAVAIADLNGDSVPDTVTPGQNQYLALLAGRGHGTLLPPFHYIASQGRVTSIKTVAMNHAAR